MLQELPCFLLQAAPGNIVDVATLKACVQEIPGEAPEPTPADTTTPGVTATPGTVTEDSATEDSKAAA